MIIYCDFMTFQFLQCPLGPLDVTRSSKQDSRFVEFKLNLEQKRQILGIKHRIRHYKSRTIFTNTHTQWPDERTVAKGNPLISTHLRPAPPAGHNSLCDVSSRGCRIAGCCARLTVPLAPVATFTQLRRHTPDPREEVAPAGLILGWSDPITLTQMLDRAWARRRAQG